MLLKSPIPQFEINEYNGETVLVCGHCDSNYIHHKTVTVYSRPHEDGNVSETEVSGTGDVVARKQSTGRNPSSRRDGIAIGFWCEQCHYYAELTIAQHKGQTCLQWRRQVLP
jgi:hypothetical protein